MQKSRHIVKLKLDDGSEITQNIEVYGKISEDELKGHILRPHPDGTQIVDLKHLDGYKPAKSREIAAVENAAPVAAAAPAKPTVLGYNPGPESSEKAEATVADAK